MTDRKEPRRGKNKGNAPVERAPWRRVTADVIDVAQDAVTALLLDEGALGVEVIDDETRAIPGEPFTPTGRAQISATFDTRDGLERDVAARLSRVAQNFEGIRDLTLEWADVFPEDWNANFKAQWEPMRLGERVWVVPSWREHTPGDDDIVLDLDPGMAFGTGTHETTQLCMRALEHALEGRPIPSDSAAFDAKLPAKASVLDVGTGSGILALAAKKLGAGMVRGTDNDPHAVDIAAENAAANACAVAMSEDAPDHWGATFDLVIANILAPTLIALAPSIVGAVKPGGTLLLSGILSPQAGDVVTAYANAGMKHVGTQTQGEWVRLDLVRAG